MRAALNGLRSRVLAWACQRSPRSPAGVPEAQIGGFDVVVIATAPKRIVRSALMPLAGRGTGVHCMSMSEWMTRLEKGDVLLRRMRRARKLWVVGSWSELVHEERGVIERRATLRAALADWREQLSDEWGRGLGSVGYGLTAKISLVDQLSPSIWIP